MKSITLFFTLCLLLNFSGCSSLAELQEVNWPADELYLKAKEELEAGGYDTAIKYYELLEAREPFGKYAQQAQLDVIYAYYKFNEPESAIVAADRFIKLYPRHVYVDYAFYLKGLVNFERNQGMLARLLKLDRSQREQGAAMQSFQDFSELVTRFPDSKYSADARQRMVYLRNMLAKYELHVAKFYMKRGAYVAAANRASNVIKFYQRTPAIPDALVTLTKAYKILGLNDLSESTLKVLKLNYPNHEKIAVVENLVVK